MATAGAIPSDPNIHVDETTRRRRIRAWVMYDWANSAFATTIMAAFLPAYYSSVAGASLPSEATATAYWSLTLSLSVFIVAILSPILGTISDVMRGKKRFLAGFALIGIIGTGLLVLVSTGDWFLASVLMVIGRTGFAGANVFYDALLPHVARDDEQDSVSARGFALGYLGGGILLAINVVMFLFIPDSVFENAGIRLSFLSVGIWWGIFTIPILRTVPEPRSATERLQPGESLFRVSFRRLIQTFRDLRQYRELFKYLIAFLVYTDPINTIIGLAVIYGAELRFGTLELVLALLLVQFVGVPFTLIFGRLPARNDKRRHQYLAYIMFNMVMLPLVAIIAAQVLPIDITGQQPAPYETTADYYGEGVYSVGSEALQADGAWEQITITGEEQAGDGFLAALAGTPEDVDYIRTDTTEARYDFPINGKQLTITHDVGPDRGQLAVLVDGEALEDTEETDAGTVITPVVVDMYNETLRYNEITTIELPEAGEHVVTLVNMAQANAESSGSVASIARLEVQPPVRVNSLPAIIGILIAVELIGVVFAALFGGMFKPLAERMDTRNSILLAIAMYCIISAWGFFLNSTIEFWFLAWMVATVQGGSQALGRSLYAALSPSSKSGEFFGLYSILSKGASVIGSGIFAGAALLFNNSRPAILSLIIFFLLGAYLLTRVDIEEGKRLAREEDARVYGTATS